MIPKWSIVAGALLDRAADRFVNHGCNDWKWPESWSRDEKDFDLYEQIKRRIKARVAGVGVA